MLRTWWQRSQQPSTVYYDATTRRRASPPPRIRNTLISTPARKKYDEHGRQGSNPLSSTPKMWDLQVKRLRCAEVRVSFSASNTQVVSRGPVRSCRTEQSTVRLTLPGLGFVCSSARTAEIAGSIPALPIRKCLQMVNKRKHPVHAPITSCSNTGSVEELRQWKSSRGWRKWSKKLRQ